MTYHSEYKDSFLEPVPTHSQLAVLERTVSRRRDSRYFVAAFLMVPTIAILLTAVLLLYLSNRPVIVNFQVQTQFSQEHGALISGVMEKVRGCEMIEVIARTSQDEVTRVDFLDQEHRPQPRSRPLGVQRFGPWYVWATEGEGVTLFARHACPVFGTHTTQLTKFVLGQQ